MANEDSGIGDLLKQKYGTEFDNAVRMHGEGHMNACLDELNAVVTSPDKPQERTR